MADLIDPILVFDAGTTLATPYSELELVRRTAVLEPIQTLTFCALPEIVRRMNTCEGCTGGGGGGGPERPTSGIVYP